jgi:hypothetical protein
VAGGVCMQHRPGRCVVLVLVDENLHGHVLLCMRLASLS